MGPAGRFDLEDFLLLRRPLQAAALTAPLLAAGLPPPAALAEDSTRSAEDVDAHLAEQPQAAGDVRQIRLIERTNIADDFGPEFFGVDGWVRLKSCSGWLVINMKPACYIKQTFTRGDCRVEGVPSF
jgi:hypothetical protein